jgi:hypothetical protein
MLVRSHLAISISTKFFPNSFTTASYDDLLWRNQQFKALTLIPIFTVTIFWLAINLPIIATSFGGWWRFFKLNLERGSDFGSIWFALDIFGFNLPALNNLVLSFISVVAFIGLGYLVI